MEGTFSLWMMRDERWSFHKGHKSSDQWDTDQTEQTESQWAGKWPRREPSSNDSKFSVIFIYQPCKESLLDAFLDWPFGDSLLMDSGFIIGFCPVMFKWLSEQWQMREEAINRGHGIEKRRLAEEHGREDEVEGLGMEIRLSRWWENAHIRNGSLSTWGQAKRHGFARLPLRYQMMTTEARVVFRPRYAVCQSGQMASLTADQWSPALPTSLLKTYAWM